jgi:hypothetical protein
MFVTVVVVDIVVVGDIVIVAADNIMVSIFIVFISWI